MKATLRNSTITLTSDTYTYTSLLPELDREIAEKAAGLIARARESTAVPEDPEPSAHASLTHEAENEAASEPTQADSNAA
uniref:hypothetical protein n=1 Tax=Streptomyces polyasparticus TaxID=2767826 RepID=UPI003F685E80